MNFGYILRIFFKDKVIQIKNGGFFGWTFKKLLKYVKSKDYYEFERFVVLRFFLKMQKKTLTEK